MAANDIDYSNPSTDFLRSIDVRTLLPQQAPFILIGKLESFSMRSIVTSTKILEENIFVENSKISAAGLIENIAQTCAARIGYINKYILAKDIQIGFIGAVKKFNVSEFPKPGDNIKTIVTIIEEIFGMLLAEATIELQGKIIVSAEMKIAIKEN